MQQHCFYLHGFKSSGQALKARQIAAYLHTHDSNHHSSIIFHQPTLASYPADAISRLEQEISPLLPHVSLIGSSLGGYYAAFLAQKYQLAAVLLNPAAHPYDLLQDMLGKHTNPYTGEVFTLTEQHIAELQALDVKSFSCPQRIRVLIQTGDEVLDYRQAASKYKACQVQLEEGGCHEFLGFEQHIAGIIEFLQLNHTENL